MIAKIAGTIEHLYEDSLIVTVQGIGYQIFCTKTLLSNAHVGKTVNLIVATQIKDQQYILMFGFENETEKMLFLLLQSVSGVGSKMAISLLSHLSPQDLSIAITTQDKEMLKQISGVGTKLADRIILELKAKIAAMHISRNDDTCISSTISDAAAALTTLGINYTDAVDKVRKAYKKSQNVNIALEDLIKLALKQE